eukprot:2064647-Amphidinium_carterae.1
MFKSRQQLVSTEHIASSNTYFICLHSPHHRTSSTCRSLGVPLVFAHLHMLTEGKDGLISGFRSHLGSSGWAEVGENASLDLYVAGFAIIRSASSPKKSVRIHSSQDYSGRASRASVGA